MQYLKKIRLLALNYIKTWVYSLLGRSKVKLPKDNLEQPRIGQNVIAGYSKYI